MKDRDRPDLALDTANLPRHVAIVMDGNGRWGERHRQARISGHRQGAKATRDIVKASRELEILALTLFAFSERNWGRPRHEVDTLMDLLQTYLEQEAKEIINNGIRLAAIGDLSSLPNATRGALEALIEATATNRGMTLTLALSYGGQSDIVEAARRLCRDIQKNAIGPDDISHRAFEARLMTAALPPVDLLIRTGGEKRLSNFLLWQVAYAELLFVETLWPDFDRKDLILAIAEYQRRERRFGGLSQGSGK